MALRFRNPLASFDQPGAVTCTESYYSYCPNVWGAKVEFNAYFLILEIHFLILEINFLILEVQFLILENEFLIHIRKCIF